MVGIADENGLVKPHAWVIVRGAFRDRDGLERALSDFVAHELQPYKAPRSVHLVDELPRTHLGKIDRGKLKRAE